MTVVLVVAVVAVVAAGAIYKRISFKKHASYMHHMSWAANMPEKKKKKNFCQVLASGARTIISCH